MGALANFLSGHTVYMALDRMFEKKREPRYRRKAQEQGFEQEFEEELKRQRYYNTGFASVFAYRNAQLRAQEANR